MSSPRAEWGGIVDAWNLTDQLSGTNSALEGDSKIFLVVYIVSEKEVDKPPQRSRVCIPDWRHERRDTKEVARARRNSGRVDVAPAPRMGFHCLL